ncbi:MAG: hypothetical protein K8R68_00245, partial [Bacteroidales bacterium]|nr:hypothetical protein [Bacteroidales bacterium]
GIFRPAARRIVHPLTITGKREENKTKSRITEPINEITLITPNKEEQEKNDESISTETKTEEISKALTLDLTFKKEENATVGEIQLKETNKSITETLKSVKPVKSTFSDNQDFPVEIERNEIEKKSRERIRKLKDLSIKLRSPNEIDELEKTPAYIRRNVELADVKPSSETEISRFTLSEGEDKEVEINSSNSFLHDNVD